MSYLSIVVPCYNSGNSLIKLVEELIEKRYELNIAEIILVCDACPSDTWKLIKNLQKKYPEVVLGFLLGKNVGQHKTTLFGMSKSTGGRIVTMDDDGQHLPSEITKLVQTLNGNADVVYGISFEEEHSFVRSGLSRLVKLLAARVGIMRHAKSISSFRIIRREVLPEPKVLSRFEGQVDSLLIRRTNRVIPVKVRMNKRDSGKSNYSYRMLFDHAISLIFNSSDTAMKLITRFSLLGTLLSSSLFLLTAISFALGKIAIPGYATVVFLITITSSIVIGVLGLIGQSVITLVQSNSGNEEIWVREQLTSQ